jgi:biphenyl 2,3-dioxygenase beta subunit
LHSESDFAGRGRLRGIWVGERTDLLRRDDEQELRIARRKILLDQNVVLSKNLSVFF